MSFKNREGGSVWVAVAIVIAGLIIAGAVMFSNSDGGNGSTGNGHGNQVDGGYGDLSLVRAPEEGDWIKGDLSAKVTIIEYSDTECPFCKRLHETLDQVVDEYGSDVAWVYRQLPLTQLHSKAVIEAHATECAGELGGNQGFWDYTDRLYEVTPSNNGLDLAGLPNIAEEVGLDRVAFEACMEEERHLELIEEDFREAVQAAGTELGTPFNIVIGPDGERTPISGALPIDNWRAMIDGLLAE